MTQARVIKEEKTSVEKIPPSNYHVGKFVEYFLINDWYGKVQPTMGGDISRKVVLDAVSKQASKQASYRRKISK